MNLHKLIDRLHCLDARIDGMIELARPAKKDGELSPVVKSGLGGAASGLLIGGALTGLRRGSSLAKTLKSATTAATVTGGGVAASQVIGQKVVGKPKRGESGAYTTRGAIGGLIGGGVLGAAGLIAARRSAAGQQWLKSAGRQWRPVHAMRTGKPIKAIGVAAGAGSVAGSYQAADEGMQVDTIENLRRRG